MVDVDHTYARTSRLASRSHRLDELADRDGLAPQPAPDGLRWGPEGPGPAVSHLDGASRAQVASHVQRAAGNTAVQRLVDRTQRAEAAERLADTDISRRIEAARGGGTHLDRHVRRRLEPGLGGELRDVRVHTDAEADELARSVGATAFTTGQDIFFRSGSYSPRSREGLRLLAHEASHTIQQAEGGVDGTEVSGGLSVSHPADRFERAAERAAEHVVSGGRLSPSDPPPAPATSPARQTSVQRYGVGNVTRGLWDAAEFVPGIGNALSLATAAGHGAGAVGDFLKGDTAGAQKAGVATADNFLNAIPVYGNIRAGHQAYQNFAGGNPEEAFAAPGGGAAKLRSGILGAGSGLWDLL